MIVSKCLCCCSLKYGFYTYGIMCLIVRICIAAIVYFLKDVIYTSSYNRHMAYETNLVNGLIFGWCISTCGILFLALLGICQKRSIFMFPFIVVLFFEMLFLVTISIYLCVQDSLWHLLDLFIGGGIDVYCVICLISLFQHTKEAEKNRPQVESVTFKTI